MGTSNVAWPPDFEVSNPSLASIARTKQIGDKIELVLELKDEAPPGSFQFYLAGNTHSELSVMVPCSGTIITDVNIAPTTVQLKPNSDGALEGQCIIWPSSGVSLGAVLSIDHPPEMEVVLVSNSASRHKTFRVLVPVSAKPAAPTKVLINFSFEGVSKPVTVPIHL
jgi:hypothetical protein